MPTYQFTHLQSEKLINSMNELINEFMRIIDSNDETRKMLIESEIAEKEIATVLAILHTCEM